MMTCVARNIDSLTCRLTGAVAFIRSVSIEAVGLGVHLAGGAHDLLLKTERALTAVPPPSTSREARKPKDNIRANQPEGAHQGLKQVLSELRDKNISCSANKRQLNLQEAPALLMSCFDLFCFVRNGP
jgi:uncharacterized membrane protein